MRDGQLDRVDQTRAALHASLARLVIRERADAAATAPYPAIPAVPGIGTLEIDGDEGPLSAGGPVPRLVLSALLARPGVAVPGDGLLDAAWLDEPPPSAERSLQSHLTRLGEALADLGPRATIERVWRSAEALCRTAAECAWRGVRLPRTDP